MRIAHFSDCYTPRINGVTTSIQVLKQALEEAGHEVHVFVPNYPKVAPEPGVHRMASMYMPLQPEDRMGVPWPPSQVKALFGQRYDAVHVHTPFNMGWLGWSKSRLQRTPMVFTHHTLWEEYAHYLKIVPIKVGRWVGRQLCDFYFQRSAAIVMPSQQVADSLVGSRVKRPCRVIPTGIRCQDLQGGEPQVVWDELGVPAGTSIFLYVGRMGKEKSIDFLLRAFAEYREQGGEAVFVLIGGGPELAGLKNLSEQLRLGESVRFIGYRTRDRLKNYLSVARLFLFASQTETQGLVLLEAAAAGVPVVAVKASGVNEAVENNGSGCLLDPGDLTGCVSAMKRLVFSHEEHARLSQRARVWADSFSAREMGRKMVDLYRSLGA
ncbi:glycosyltransferase [bacterium]|nr:glycosyltransferase [bacterium]